MRVALIDFDPGGHHATYARELARALRAAGDEPISIGPLSWCDALKADATPRPIAWSLMGRTDGVPRAARTTFVRLAMQEAVRAGVEAAHLLYFDGFGAAFLKADRNPPFGVVATIHAVPFLGLSLRMPRELAKGLLALHLLGRLGRTSPRFHLRTHSRRAAERVRSWGLERVEALDYPSAVAPARSIDLDGRKRRRERLGVKDGEVLALCFGGTRRDKGADLAVEAAARCRGTVKVLIAGAEQELKRDVLTGDRVLLELGHVADEEVVEIFSAADLAIFPYRRGFRGQSGPLVMAGALGVPVLASNVPVLAETVERYGLGRTVPAEDVGALAAALAGPIPAVRPEAHEAFALASDPKRFAAAYLEAYRKAAANP